MEKNLYEDLFEFHLNSMLALLGDCKIQKSSEEFIKSLAEAKLFKHWAKIHYAISNHNPFFTHYRDAYNLSDYSFDEMYRTATNCIHWEDILIHKKRLIEENRLKEAQNSLLLSKINIPALHMPSGSQDLSDTICLIKIYAHRQTPIF